MKIYLAELDRFGYTLSAVATTEDEAVRAIMREYRREYKKTNGTNPGQDINELFGRSYSAAAREDIIVTEYTMGRVEWR